MLNVLLIQPPDAPPPIAPVDCTTDSATLFAPPHNLLALRTFLHERTRHLCTFIDCRLFSDLEPQLVTAIRAVPDPRIVVVHTTSTGLGSTSAVLEISKRFFPQIRTVLCGQNPSQFPTLALDLARADYALAGDPEPILRNLLDYLDVAQRLRRIPGLIYRGGEKAEAYWLGDLKTLSLPDWEGVHWPAYQRGLGKPICRAELRLSRGHTRTPADRAAGDQAEPLRIWPLDRAAAAVSRSAHHGITEVCLTDPPGFWNSDRLRQWCQALAAINNTRPWSFQMLPMRLDSDLIAALAANACRRVELLYPTCDPATLKLYGCEVLPREMGQIANRLEQSRISISARFWIGGPETTEHDDELLVQTIRQLNYLPHVIQPFPLLFDSPLYRKFAVPGGPAPAMTDWTHWALAPWTATRPVPLWGGAQQLEPLKARMLAVESAIQHSPGRMLRQLAGQFLAKDWILSLENKALNWLMAKPAAGGRP